MLDPSWNAIVKLYGAAGPEDKLLPFSLAKRLTIIAGAVQKLMG